MPAYLISAARPAAALLAGIVAVAVASWGLAAWVDSRAVAATAPQTVRLQAHEALDAERWREFRDDIKATRTASEQAAKDAAYLRGRIDAR